MKLSKKVISIILSAVMVFSMASVALAGTLKTEKYDTVEQLIQNESLGNILESLITDINNAKADITGTILRLVFTFMRDKDLSAVINGRNVSTLTDDEAAKILLDWLDKCLPVWTKDITNQSWYKPVSGIVKLIGVTLDLKSVDGVIKTLYSVCDAANASGLIKNKIYDKRYAINLGIANGLNESALKNISRSKGDMKVIHALIQWLKDNMPVVKLALNGNLSLGTADKLVDLDDMEKSIKNVPFFVKSALYRLIDGYAAMGKFSKNVAEAKGDWGNSPYADYSADEILAVALIRLIKKTDDVITQEEADAALTLSFYEILTTYAGDLYNNYAVKWINDNLSKFIKNISVTDEIKAVFKEEIPEVNNETIADLIEGAKTTGVLGQFNALLIKVAELVLTPAEFEKLALEKGGNDKLNANLEKVFHLILPLMANETVSNNLGFDFTAFTKDAVQKMNLEDMAVAVLKIFFDGWFHTNENYDAAAVSGAETLEQLGVLAVYYTGTNTNWMPAEFDFSSFREKIFDGNKVNALEKEAAEDLAVSMGVQIGVNSLKLSAENTNYISDIHGGGTVLLGDVDGSGKLEAADARLALRLAVGFDDSATEESFYPEAADADGNGKVEAGDARTILRSAVGLELLEGVIDLGGEPTWRDYVDDVSDWALNYIQGLPAIVRSSGMTTQRNVYDPYQEGTFNKLNLVLNELINFSFLNNVGNETYPLDLEKLIFNGLLGNFFEFDVAGLLGIFAVNDNPNNILNQKFIPAVLGVADKLITALFKTA